MGISEQVRRLRQGDRRADGATRDVRLEARNVTISRRFQGIEMRVGVPVTAYVGVVLSLEADALARPVYRISLRHVDPDLSIDLLQTADDRDIVAEWKDWAAYFSLPKFIERQPGELEGAERRVGSVGLGRVRAQRRRGSTISARRPRALTRRKPGRDIAGAPVIRDARVIISYE